MKVESGTRVVFVLGRKTTLDVGAIQASGDSASEILLLSVGYPVTPAQRRAIDGALGLAPHLDIVVDIQLVTVPEELPALVEAGSRVVVTGSAREQRRLRRLLRLG
ncbi:MAG: hypothetical protein ACXWX5_12525 [Actinomycetota bacterium]